RPRITYHFELRNNKYEMIAEGPPIILTVHQPALDIMIQSDQDDTKVQIGETINYTITLTNNGTLDIMQGIVYHELSPAIKFERGHVVIRRQQMGIEQLDQGINIGDLAIGESLMIQYKAIAIGYYEKAIQTSVYAKYKFILNKQETRQSIQTPQITHETKILSPYLKHVREKRTFILPVGSPDMKVVKYVKASVVASGIRQVIQERKEVEIAVQLAYELAYSDYQSQVQLVGFGQLMLEQLKYTEVKQPKAFVLTVEVEKAQVEMINQRQVEIWLDLVIDV
ncbi:MAG: hypothetical protein ACRCW2_07980, partial [Cellulosilyticaceae bacterium]